VHRKVLIAAGLSGAVSAALGIAGNIAAGDLPRWASVLRPWIWPLVAFLFLGTVALAVWEYQTVSATASGLLPESGAVPTSRPRELPRDVRSFCGRDDDLRRVRRSARTRGIAIVAGKPGIGKTALAIRTAHSLRDSYPDGQVFVDMQGLRDPATTPREAMLHVLRAFDQADGLGEGDIAARYRSALAGKRVIILLDDAEDAAQVRPLLPPDKRSLALITSRRPLADLTEAPHAVTLKVLDERSALSMLSSLTGDNRVQADPEKSKNLVSQCGALPLALLIAAAQLRRHPRWAVGDLVGRLRDERHRLDELHVADLEVRACIALSYTDLGPDARSWFRWLAVIPGPSFSPEAAAAALGLELAKASLALGELEDAQLVEDPQPTGQQEDRTPRQPRLQRYRFHTLIRIYAEEKLHEEDSAALREALLTRVLADYADRLDRASSAVRGRSVISAIRPALADDQAGSGGQVMKLAPQGQPDESTSPEVAEAQSFQWLRDESDSLVSVVLASGQADPAVSWRLACSFLMSCERMLPAPELSTLSGFAEAAATRLGDPRAVMIARYLRGRAERRSGHLTEAARLLQESARDLVAAEHSQDASDALLLLGRIQRERRDLDQAAAALESAFILRRADNDANGAASVLLEVGVLLKEAGHLEDAARVLRFAIDQITAATEPGTNRTWKAWAHENLGAILKRQGKLDEARAHHEESVATFREVDDLTGQAFACGNLGDLELESGHLEAAKDRYRESLQWFRQARDHRGEALALLRLGLVLLRGRRITRSAQVLMNCLFAALRAGYLGELLHQVRTYRQGNNSTAMTIATPAIERLARTVRDPLPDISR
jgi:tetratricopeptide (TPR) repeat protein